MHFQQQIARFAAVVARATLAGQSDHLTFAHALGDLDLHLALFRDDVAVLVDLATVQGQHALDPLVTVDQIQLNAGVLVLATHGRHAAARTSGAASTALGTGLTEHLVEEIAVVGVAVHVLAAEIEIARVEPFGILERVASARSACKAARRVQHGVILGALFHIRQHGIGLVQFGHAFVGILFLADVGVVFAGQLAIRLFDIVR
ncbi:hypothetical protein D3C72_1460580 [compost metagenome]